MKIGIFGGGFVGHAIARGWMEHADVLVHDIVPERSTATWEDTAACDLVFLCLPTVAANTETGYDMGPLDRWFERRATMPPRDSQIVVIKSTVPVGYTRQQYLKYSDSVPRLLHNPEFLTARCAVADYMTPAQQVIGCPCLDDWLNAAKDLQSMYADRWPGIKVHVADSDTTELAKLSLNSFFAAKVAFFNAVRNIASAVGADFSTIRQIMLADGRVAAAHTAVPGPDGKPGFGGACLPKDLGALIAAATGDSERSFLTAIQDFNDYGCGRAEG